MLYVITDKRDNTYYCGLQGWSNLEENALWYGPDSLNSLQEMNELLLHLREKEGDHFYAQALPIEI